MWTSCRDADAVSDVRTAIRRFEWRDYDDVIALWKDAGLTVGPSESRSGIELKLKRDPELFLVATHDNTLVGAVLGAFDGRRGRIYHLAVRRPAQGSGVGGALLEEVERRLRDLGSRKVNLLVAPENLGVVRFYQRLGYRRDDLVFMEKWLDRGTGNDDSE